MKTLVLALLSVVLHSHTIALRCYRTEPVHYSEVFRCLESRKRDFPAPTLRAVVEDMLDAYRGRIPWECAIATHVEYMDNKFY